MSSLGIRQNNPGNIRWNSETKWMGQQVDPGEKGFVVFTSPYWGIRAMAKVLLNYQLRHGLKTIREFIIRWAPPSENNTEAYVADVDKLVAAVEKFTSVNPDEVYDLRNDGNLLSLIEAIIHHENGEQPYTVGELTSPIRALLLVG